MKFVPVTGCEVLFCIWETRVKDYAACAQANSGVDRSWQKVEWKEAPLSDGPDHPVTMVSWEEAKAFCEWLTRKERMEGRLKSEQQYRLPTDLEWSVAVGLGRENGRTPKERDREIPGVYPWGRTWPPLTAVGNYADETARAKFGTNLTTITGYRDFYATTAPVGSFTSNHHGIFDLGGNVWEWCEDWHDIDQTHRVLRGGSWDYSHPSSLLSSSRGRGVPGFRHGHAGFRCVLVVGGLTPR